MLNMLWTGLGALLFAVVVSASPVSTTAVSNATTTASTTTVAASSTLTAPSRDFLKSLVTEVLNSMVANDPFKLTLAEAYKATENTHPAALNMMTLWRTVTTAGDPSILAVDTTLGTAYFALDITEYNGTAQSILWGRIKVADQLLTEFEFYVNRGRGEDGFAFDPENLPGNYKNWQSPPDDRLIANRSILEQIAASSFNMNDTYIPDFADDCQFTEMGWVVKNAACNWMPNRPTDLKARTIAIDEELGIVVTAGVVPGKVYPYATFSAFIPNDMKTQQETQDTWYSIQESESYIYLIEPMAATGTSFNIFQYYNNQLQGERFNVYLVGPENGTVWA